MARAHSTRSGPPAGARRSGRAASPATSARQAKPTTGGGNRRGTGRPSAGEGRRGSGGVATARGAHPGRPESSRSTVGWPPSGLRGLARGRLFAWGAVVIVVLVVAVVIVVGETAGRSPDTKVATSVRYTARPVPASILRAVTRVPASAYDRVGLADAVVVPSVLAKATPLAFTGKPGVFVLDGEFCPFCAAERWAVVTSLARFGTFSGLETMQSSPVDVDPRTQLAIKPSIPVQAAFFTAG